mmetsp:Transcript_6563/g.9657  ORF Transcript_6563/g.9657 Transcript_6563/m.9657 type:complete len:90 (-) Transcript_6563:217-486(-)
MEVTTALNSDQWAGDMCTNCLLLVHSTMSFQSWRSVQIWRRPIILEKKSVPNNLYRVIMQSENTIIVGEISLSDCRFVCRTLAEFDGAA